MTSVIGSFSTLVAGDVPAKFQLCCFFLLFCFSLNKAPVTFHYHYLLEHLFAFVLVKPLINYLWSRFICQSKPNQVNLCVSLFSFDFSHPLSRLIWLFWFASHIYFSSSIQYSYSPSIYLAFAQQWPSAIIGDFWPAYICRVSLRLHLFQLKIFFGKTIS